MNRRRRMVGNPKCTKCYACAPSKRSPGDVSAPLIKTYKSHETQCLSIMQEVLPCALKILQDNVNAPLAKALKLRCTEVQALCLCIKKPARGRRTVGYWLHLGKQEILRLCITSNRGQGRCTICTIPIITQNARSAMPVGTKKPAHNTWSAMPVHQKTTQGKVNKQAAKPINIHDKQHTCMNMSCGWGTVGWMWQRIVDEIDNFASTKTRLKVNCASKSAYNLKVLGRCWRPRMHKMHRLSTQTTDRDVSAWWCTIGKDMYSAWITAPVHNELRVVGKWLDRVGKKEHDLQNDIQCTICNVHMYIQKSLES